MNAGGRPAGRSRAEVRQARDRGSGYRPSREERGLYTDALAQAVGEGRLTDALYEERLAAVEEASSFTELDAVVADIPFDPPDPERAAVRRRLFRGIAAAAAALVFSGGALFGLVKGAEALFGDEDSAQSEAQKEAQGEGPENEQGDAEAAGETGAGGVEDVAGEAGADGGGAGGGADGSAGDGSGAGEEAPGAQAPQIATELKSVAPMSEETVRQAVAGAREAGVTRVEGIWLYPEQTRVDGVTGDDAHVSVYFREGRTGTVTEGSQWAEQYVDLDELDFSLAEVEQAAREFADGETSPISSYAIYRGTGDAYSYGITGNAIDVDFEHSDAEPYGVAAPLSDFLR